MRPHLPETVICKTHPQTLRECSALAQTKSEPVTRKIRVPCRANHKGVTYSVTFLEGARDVLALVRDEQPIEVTFSASVGTQRGQGNQRGAGASKGRQNNLTFRGRYSTSTSPSTGKKTLRPCKEGRPRDRKPCNDCQDPATSKDRAIYHSPNRFGALCD